MEPENQPAIAEVHAQRSTQHQEPLGICKLSISGIQFPYLRFKSYNISAVGKELCSSCQSLNGTEVPRRSATSSFGVDKFTLISNRQWLAHNLTQLGACRRMRRNDSHCFIRTRSRVVHCAMSSALRALQRQISRMRRCLQAESINFTCASVTADPTCCQRTELWCNAPLKFNTLTKQQC